MTPRVARALGAGRGEAAAQVGIQALLLAVLLGGLVTAVGVLFTGPVVRAFGASDEVVRFAEPYLRIRSLAAIPVLLAQVGQGYLRGAQDTKTPTIIVVAGAAANVVVGYLFIFPLGWGIEGAAWAVVLCQAGAAATFVVVLRARMTRCPWRADLIVMRSLLCVGGQLALRTGSLLVGLTVATSIAARIDTATLAAWQVTMQMFLLLSLTLDAVAIAAQALVAVRLGAGETPAARLVGERLIALGIYLGVALGLVTLVGARPLSGLFTESAQVGSLAAGLLIWLALLQPLGGLAFTLDGILIGASDTGFLALAMLGSTVVFVGTTLVLFGLGAGVWSLVIGTSAWMAMRGLTTFVRFRRELWTGPSARAAV